MTIYEREIFDGLQEQIQAKASVMFDCQVIPGFSNPSDEQIKKSLAYLGIEKDQTDLYYLNSVLVSAGWNKNDDVFTVENLWAARNTPVNKQFNYMHDDNDIIGHITGSMVINKDGEVIEDGEDLPNHIDIITSAVIYRAWSDPEVRARIEKLISEIDDGKWAVSMECIFSDFDYAIVGPDNQNKVLARNADSAFLTKHLRVYGGSGEYQGYKVGRLLKSFYFSGKGLVSQPANPRSIIFKRTSDPFENKSNIEVSNFLAAMEVQMPKEVEKHEDLEAKANEIQTQFDEYKTKAEESKLEMLKDSEKIVAEKNSAIATLESKVKELENTIAQIQAIKDEQEKEIAKMKEECSTTEKKMKCMKRKAQLVSAGLSDDRVETISKAFEDASDEMFDSVVALLNEPAPKTDAAPKEEMKEEKEDVEDEDDDCVAKQLDTVEAPASASLANPTDENAIANAIASASEWISKSVLKTTKNLNKKG